MKRVVLTIINIFSVAVIVFSLLILLTVVMTGSGQVPSFLGYSVFHVVTGSMEPSIPVDSLLVVRQVDVEEVEVGDIITFYSRDPALGGSPNTHRVAAIEEDEDGIRFVTRGDANPVDDEYTTGAAELIGVVVFSSLFLGKAVRVMSNPLVFFPLLIVPLAILLLTNLFSTMRMARQAARAEEEEAIAEILQQLEAQKKAVKAPDEEPGDEQNE